MMRRMLRLLWFLCGSERKGCGGSGGREKSGRRKGEEMEKEQGRACGFPHPDHRGNEKAALPHAGTPCQEVRQRKCQTLLHPRSKSSVPFSDPNRTEGSCLDNPPFRSAPWRAGITVQARAFLLPMDVLQGDREGAETAARCFGSIPAMSILSFFQ